MKNISWKHEDPKLVPIEHVHFYHSHNSKGKVKIYSAPVGGHYHKVTVTVDTKTGVVTAVCGPPLRDAIIKKRKRKIKVVQSVTYSTGEGANDFETDTHTHDVEYLHSEIISSNKQEAAALKDQAKLQQLGGVKYSDKPTQTLPDSTGSTETDKVKTADGKSTVEEL